DARTRAAPRGRPRRAHPRVAARPCRTQPAGARPPHGSRLPRTTAGAARRAPRRLRRRARLVAPGAEPRLADRARQGRRAGALVVTSIPLTEAGRLAGLARRTAAIRLALVVVVLGATVAAILIARHPDTRVLVPLSGRGDTIVVLDLSASISTDTYSQIGATLSSLARSNGRLGLVVFSDQAYEALPQGTPAANLAPLVRLFTLPKTT